VRRKQKPPRAPDSEHVESKQSGTPTHDGSSASARLLLSLQQSAGHRAVRQLVRRNDTGLPDELKSGVESLSGVSLDPVRVHYNSSRPAALDALAFAQGTEIHVAPGQERHLPHEAWHVVQQAQGRVQATAQLREGVPVNDDDSLEREADAMGATASAAPGAAAPAQRTTARGGPPVVQRVLGVANPIVTADVAHVTRFGTKLAYLLTGHANDSVVIKFEMPGGGETLAQLGARREAIYDLARTVLENTPQARALTAADMNALQQLNFPNQPGAVNLVGNLQNNLAQQSIALKIENAGVLESLQVKIQQGTAALALLSPTVLRQFGKMAFVDLLVGNTDRFQPGGAVNDQNLDFNAAGETVPLDNLDPFGGGIPVGLPFPGQNEIVNQAARRGYAMSAVLNLLAAMTLQPGMRQVGRMADEFATGMEDAKTECMRRARRFRLLARNPRTAATPTGTVAQALAGRLGAIT
jgi:Domain of unknown function (DUF4157)